MKDRELDVMAKLLKVLNRLPDNETRAWVLGFAAHKLGNREQARKIAVAIGAGTIREEPGEPGVCANGSLKR